MTTLRILDFAERRKARECHPDMHPNEKEKYTSKMADINAAFEVLTKYRQRPNSE
jgi:curved DNA-binding protein CbpA